MPLNFVLAGRVGPINGGFRDYYFSVCNLTGSTANDARNHNPLGRQLQFAFTKQF